MCFRIVLTLVVALVLAGRVTWAQGVDERYVHIYNLIQDADASVIGGQAASAREKYLEAQGALEELHTALPGWNEAVVQFRLKYIAEKLQLLGLNDPSAADKNVRGASSPADGGEGTTRPLREQISRLAADNEMLQSKLKEALSAQPANVDSRELARSEETIKALQKELEVLRVRLTEAEARPDRPISREVYQETLRELSDVRQKVAEQGEMIMSLSLEKKALRTQLLSTEQAVQLKRLSDENLELKQQVDTLRLHVESNVGAEILAGQFGGLQKQLLSQQSRNEVLLAEKQILEEQLTRLEKRRDVDGLEATKQLERALAEARSAIQSSNDTVSALRDSLRAAQEARERLEGEKAEIQAQVSAARSALGLERLARIKSDSRASSSLGELVQIQRERDELKGQLTAVSRELQETQTRLQLVEAKQSRGRDADLNVALVSTRPRKGGVTSSQALPPEFRPASQASVGTDDPQTLAAITNRAGSNQNTEESPATLAHMAAIQLDQNRLADAELTLKTALEKDPTNAMSLRLLGQLQVRKRNFDAALETLSQAVKLDPKNAEACNFLGLTLMEKGLSDPAEFALLRSVRLSPNYGDAHFNLAVVYLRRRPPAYGKAFEHYQRALADGHSIDPAVEADLKRGSPASIAR